MSRRPSADIMADIVRALIDAPRSKVELRQLADAHQMSIDRCIDALLRRRLVTNGEVRILPRGGREKLYRWTAQ